MKLRALTALALAMAFAALAVGTPPDADARRASTRLTSVGGHADITKQWFWRPDLGLYEVRYWGVLKDRKGDGRHARLYRQTESSLLGVRKATYGKRVKFSGGPIYARSVHFKVCTYDGKKLISCTGLW